MTSIGLLHSFAIDLTLQSFGLIKIISAEAVEMRKSSTTNGNA